MIILQLTTTEFLGLAFALALVMLCAVIASYCLGSGSVNVELEVMRRVSSPNIKLVGYQPYVRENVKAQTPTQPAPPRSV
ncbi:hypothetical protein PH505_bb00130 [Pseudoalteromonas distincta]|uniref:hypothetical protein n=1 Tax=Pseudoalteromonas distincta TaxID=77608 RepID=UPI00020A0BB2|nr:hypothetical protein [Pseudoalteromonas distincta]EGI72865.1 hypothetical protein PH505_bb00130 [Pseudoalteromonas distincta]